MIATLLPSPCSQQQQQKKKNSTTANLLSLPIFVSSIKKKKWAIVGNEVKKVGGENFGAKKGAAKSLGNRRGCVFGSSPKQLEQPHPELVQ
jgi:hypothetical protein